MAPHSPNPYSRMPGRGYGFATRSRGWLANDHLLYVEAAWFVERYRRFHFRDIQSIVIQRTSRIHLWTVLWAIPLLSGFAMALVPTRSGAVRVTGWVFVALATVGLAVNAARGPTCRFVLQTRVNRQPIRCWHRLRVARRAAEQLQAAVEAAQGTFSEVEFAAAVAAGMEPPANAHAEAVLRPAVPPPPPAAPARAGGTRWHAVCAATLVVEAVAAGASIVVRAAPMLMGTLVMSFLLFGLCAVALVRGAGGRVPRGLRIWAWSLFAYLALRGTVAYFWGLGRYMAVAMTGKQPDDWVVLFFNTWAGDSLFLGYFFGLVCVLSAAFAATGFLFARRAHRQRMA